MKLLFLVLTLLISVNTFSQRKKINRKVSNEKGTIFVSWGYNRSVYTQSNLYLKGNGYDFNLEHSKATDNQSKLNSGDYTLSTLSVPQYNFKIGYYYKKKWSIAFAVDHMKYIFSDNNEVAISGNATFLQNQDVSFGNGYSFHNVFLYSQPLTTNRNEFHYANSKGLNYIHAELGWAEKLYVAGKKGNFVITSNMGFGTGLLLSYTELLLNGSQSQTVKSLSGYGLSSFAGLRFEIFKHAYIYSNFSIGFLHKVSERTDLIDINERASQRLGYSQIEAGLGLFLFKRVKNGCDDCPVW